MPTTQPSAPRRWTGLALSALAVLVLIAGILAPGLAVPALPVAGALILVTWRVSRVPVPPALIVAWAVTVVVTALTVGVAAFVALSSPTGLGDGFPWWLWIMVLSYAVTAGGAAWYLARHVRAIRARDPESA